MTTDQASREAKAEKRTEIPLKGYYGGKPTRFSIEYDDNSSTHIGNADGSVDAIVAALTHANTEMEKMRWQPIETAPKDKEILLHVVGYPWTCLGIWNEPSKKWCYAQLSVDLYEGKWNDTSFQNEYEVEIDSKGLPNVIGWQPLPALPPTPKAEG